MVSAPTTTPVASSVASAGTSASASPRRGTNTAAIPASAKPPPSFATSGAVIATDGRQRGGRHAQPVRSGLRWPRSTSSPSLATAPPTRPGRAPELSIVVTLYDEERTLEELYRRIVATLGDRPYELIFVDDGSRDGTWPIVERLHAADPRVRAVRFKRNFGQHPAMHAGLARARGELVVTMDGDLQNQPEDIPKLVAALADGTDVASGRRAARHDSWGRTLPSRLINGMLRRFTGVEIADFGCAFNAYRRTAVTPMLGAIGKQKFTKALILSGGASVVEVDVGHAARAGSSRYSPLRLTRLALHVLAGFWPQPIQWIGVALGAVCSLLATVLLAYGIWFWIAREDFPGPLLGGVAVLFVLGIQGFILALVGEYLGRIQREVEGRPLYSIDGGACEQSGSGHRRRRVHLVQLHPPPAGAHAPTRSSRSTRSPTPATSRTSPT